MRTAAFAGFVILIFIGAFQSCGKPKFDLGADPGAVGFPLEYPYSSKPEYYVDVQMLAVEGSSDKIKDFSLMINIAGLTPKTTSMTYVIDVQDAAGKTMCPSASGVLTKTQTQIVFPCVSPFVESQMHLKLKTTLKGKVSNFDFVF